MEAALKIGAVAKRAGVAVDTVRFYERRGLLTGVERQRSGYRMFTESAVTRIVFTKELQALGFTLDEVASLLRAVDRGEAECSSERGRFERVLTRVDERLAEVRHIRLSLVKTLRRCENGECSLLDEARSAPRRFPSEKRKPKAALRVGKALP